MLVTETIWPRRHMPYAVPKSETVLLTSLLETHVRLVPQGQTAQPFLIPCDLPREERFRHSNLGLQSKVFPRKKSLCLAVLPSQGSRVTANTHSSISAASTCSPGPCMVTAPPLRALPSLEKPDREAKGHTPQPGSGVFLLAT